MLPLLRTSWDLMTDTYLKTKKLYPSFLVDMVNEKLEHLLEDYNDAPGILRKALKYCLLNGGKRFRPVLCLLTAASLGKTYECALPAACAIEFIHTYSLIHDDLPCIDNDDFRRGVPTCHKVFGEDIAILTGDALFSEAFNIIIRYQDSSAETRLEILKIISDAAGASGMVAGQIIDVYYTGKKISKSMLGYMHSNKTGKLITASVRCGAVIAGTDEVTLEKLSSFAENLGLAFQITDDILDLEGSGAQTGKTAGKDQVQKKNTFPSIYGLEKSRVIAEEKINKAVEIISSLNIEKELLINIARFLVERKN
jgi:geranylgeranyl diphosphate synthase, type II